MARRGLSSRSEGATAADCRARNLRRPEGTVRTQCGGSLRPPGLPLRASCAGRCPRGGRPGPLWHARAEARGGPGAGGGAGPPGGAAAAPETRDPVPAPPGRKWNGSGFSPPRASPGPGGLSLLGPRRRPSGVLSPPGALLKRGVGPAASALRARSGSAGGPRRPAEAQAPSRPGGRAPGMFSGPGLRTLSHKPPYPCLASLLPASADSVSPTHPSTLPRPCGPIPTPLPPGPPWPTEARVPAASPAGCTAPPARPRTHTALLL